MTATIYVFEISRIYGETCWSSETIARVKVPKNASDKVIANRVKTAMEKFGER